MADSTDLADNLGIMLATPDQIRTRLQAAISVSTFDASSLARHIKRGQDYIRDFLNGRKDSIKASDLGSIEVALGLIHGSLTKPGVDDEEIVNQVKSNLIVAGEPSTQALLGRLQNWIGSENVSDFPIFSSVDLEDGIMSVGVRPIEVVPRPWFMREVREGFGLLISVDDADPLFPPGVLALINPALPALRGTNVLLQSETDTTGYRATLRKLIGKSRTHWHVERMNDREHEHLSRSDWPRAVRVVGQLNDA